MSLDPGGRPEPGKVSEMFLDFAQPLLEIDEAGPANVEALRSIVMIAMICWNLPVMEAQKAAESAATRGMFDTVMAQMPSPIRTVLNQLISERTTRFGEIPFFLNVFVKGTSLQTVRIVAEARMLKSTTPLN